MIVVNGITSIAIRHTSADQQDATYDRYRVGLHHLALRAARREDVDRFHDWLVAEGLPVLATALKSKWKSQGGPICGGPICLR